MFPDRGGISDLIWALKDRQDFRKERMKRRAFQADAKAKVMWKLWLFRRKLDF